MSSEARKMAEEALATVALRYPNGWGSYDTLSVCTDAIRALLASEPAKGADLTISGLHDNCDRCKQPIPNGCYAVLCSACDNRADAALFPAPPDGAEVRPPVCMDCSFASGGHVHVNREDGAQAVRYPTAEEWNAAMRAKPASDEVREAAEILCERLDGGAGERYYREVAPGLMDDIEALRAALRSGGR